MEIAAMDPLDAYMATIEETIQSPPKSVATKKEQTNELTSYSSKRSIFEPVKPDAADTIIDDEEEEDLSDDNNDTETGKANDGDGEGSSLNLLNAAEMIASAQKKMKKKDYIVVDHARIVYEPFRKNFLVEAAEISAMTEAEVAAYRQELGVKVKVIDTS
jgi:hypothetical protein